MKGNVVNVHSQEVQGKTHDSPAGATFRDCPLQYLLVVCWELPGYHIANYIFPQYCTYVWIDAVYLYIYINMCVYSLNKHSFHSLSIKMVYRIPIFENTILHQKRKQTSRICCGTVLFWRDPPKPLFSEKLLLAGSGKHLLIDDSPKSIQV